MSNISYLNRTCGLYVNEWHLATMLLPNINKKINDEYEIVTFFEESLLKYMKMLTNRINLSTQEKKDILDIDWDKKVLLDYARLEKHLEYIIQENDKICIIINGTAKYMDKVEQDISNYINNTKVIKKRKIEIEIINCFNIAEETLDITEMLAKYTKVLNTSGEKDIKTVLGEYLSVAN